MLEWNTKRNGLCCQEHYGHKEDCYSINQVERITGVDFFPPLPDDMEEIKFETGFRPVEIAEIRNKGNSTYEKRSLSDKSDAGKAQEKQ